VEFKPATTLEGIGPCWELPRQAGGIFRKHGKLIWSDEFTGSLRSIGISDDLLYVGVQARDVVCHSSADS
jgi:hypothetical protein